jgi:YCII-related domain
VSESKQFLAVFVGSADSPRRKAWDAMPQTEQRAKTQEGIAAWGAWAQKHQSAIVVMGGPLGKTKKVSANGVADVSNQMGGFTVVQAESHEAAAKLFDRHPHFSIFPGDGVEIMPVLPIPGM